uniref:Putative secreted protein n=1 Tax=Anopheles darlingi TaxID=43151 RepID=A0A2M4D824_ANODA
MCLMFCTLISVCGVCVPLISPALSSEQDSSFEAATYTLDPPLYPASRQRVRQRLGCCTLARGCTASGLLIASKTMPTTGGLDKQNTMITHPSHGDPRVSRESQKIEPPTGTGV